jgi:hypothetical protein
MQQHAHDFSNRVVTSNGNRAQPTVHVQAKMKFLHVRRFEMCFLDVREENSKTATVSYIPSTDLVRKQIKKSCMLT